MLGGGRSTKQPPESNRVQATLKFMNSNNPCLSTLQQWEESGKRLATELSTYRQLCVVLDNFSSAKHADSNVIAGAIDNSLETLHTKISKEFSQSQALLSQTRNKISSPAYSLPNQILAEIFMEVVFTSSREHSSILSTTKSLNRIFKSLYSLLAVCTTWKGVGVGLSKLWSIIPLGDTKSSRPTPETTSLILHRSPASNSAHHPLHLAAVLYNRYASAPPLLAGISPRFASVNIEARFDSPAYDISHLLEQLLETQSLSALSELSIHQYHDPLGEDIRPCLPKQKEYLGYSTSALKYTLLTNLIGSLAIFRLRSANIHWNNITFSAKLVNLHIQSLVLGNHSKLNEFLRVIESAPELRDVKLISVVAFTSSSHYESIAPVEISLPKLQSLVLHDLTFNVLQHVIASISSDSHRLKVGLTRKGNYNHLANGRLDRDCYEPVLDLLNRSGIDTLFLTPNDSSSRYVSYGELRSILRSLPCLKALIMSDWKWDDGSIPALERPNNGAPFPTLSQLSICHGYVYEVNLLPTIVTSHSLQTLVLDRHSSSALNRDSAGDTLQWLKNEVPDFRLLRGPMNHFSHEEWQLW